MEKRHQVFISSTFQDLQPARQEVSEALLKSNCFPAQMELWGAIDEEIFEYIKQMIDISDYFVVISAGMYGSVNEDTGLSYTEMEYDYAQSKGVPTLRFVHADPFKVLRGESIEQDAEKKAKLLGFHEKLKNGRLCKLWSEPHELGKEVILGLNDLKNRRPAVGWVRAHGIASSDAVLKIERLEKTLAELRLELAERNASTPNVDEIISQYVGKFIVKLGRLQDDGMGGFESTEEYFEICDCTESEVCRLIMIASLAEIYEAKIFYSVMNQLGHGEMDHTEFHFAEETLENFQRLMFTLESKGLFESRVLADGTTARIEWHLSRPARRWASQLRAANT